MGNRKPGVNPLQNRKRKKAPRTALFLDEAVKVARQACWDERISEEEALQTILDLKRLRKCVEHGDRPN